MSIYSYTEYLMSKMHCSISNFSYSGYFVILEDTIAMRTEGRVDIF